MARCLDQFVALGDYLGTVGPEIVQAEWLKRVDRARTLLSAYYDLHAQIVAPPPFVNGDDLIAALNRARGPWVGRALERIREAQVLGDVTSVGSDCAGAAVWQRGYDINT